MVQLSFGRSFRQIRGELGPLSEDFNDILKAAFWHYNWIQHPAFPLLASPSPKRKKKMLAGCLFLSIYLVDTLFMKQYAWEKNASFTIQ